MNTKQIALKLIYRASRDGYSSKAFHEHCDEHDNTLHVIEPASNTQCTKLPVFGAFTSIQISNVEQEHRDPNMFLFRARSDNRFPDLIRPDIYHDENVFRYHFKNYVKMHTNSCISFGSKGEERAYLYIGDNMQWRENYVGDDNITKWMEHTIGFGLSKKRLFFRIKDMEVFKVEQLIG